MRGIKNIAAYVPATVIDNFAKAAEFGEHEDFVRERLGGHVLPVMEPGMDTSDLATRAVMALIEKVSIDKNDIDCLVVCTQNPDGRGLPHVSALVQKKALLPAGIAAFDVSLGCSGYVYGLNIIRGFMIAAGLSNGILVTADPYSKIVDASDRNTKMLFGDAATATLLTGDDPVWMIKHSRYGTDGRGAEHLMNDNGRLHMNGRQVFNFAATKVPRQIGELLAKEGLEDKDIDKYVLHQGSRYILDALTSRLGVDESKVPIQLKETGNTVSSSIPLILMGMIGQEDVHNILISGFGVGWSWGTVILSRY